MNYAPEMTSTALKMIVSLIVVLGMVWGLYRIARRSLGTAPTGPNGKWIQVLASHYLGVKKSITLVQVPGAILVLGISADKVSLLSRIKDPELLSKLQNKTPTDPKRGFRDHLNRLLHPMDEGWKTANQEKQI
jgi:flagellar biosynthetic protein FliO